MEDGSMKRRTSISAFCLTLALGASDARAQLTVPPALDALTTAALAARRRPDFLKGLTSVSGLMRGVEPNLRIDLAPSVERVFAYVRAHPELEHRALKAYFSTLPNPVLFAMSKEWGTADSKWELQQEIRAVIAMMEDGGGNAARMLEEIGWLGRTRVVGRPDGRIVRIRMVISPGGPWNPDPVDQLIASHILTPLDRYDIADIEGRMKEFRMPWEIKRLYVDDDLEHVGPAKDIVRAFRLWQRMSPDARGDLVEIFGVARKNPSLSHPFLEVADLESQVLAAGSDPNALFEVLIFNVTYLRDALALFGQETRREGFIPRPQPKFSGQGARSLRALVRELRHLAESLDVPSERTLSGRLRGSRLRLSSDARDNLQQLQSFVDRLHPR
jgi:hypothetical protein